MADQENPIMARSEVIAILQEHNPDARVDDVHLYADAFLAYVEASENIRRNGNVVLHPRTGTPLQNPYVVILAGARKAIQSGEMLDVEALWATLDSC